MFTPEGYDAEADFRATGSVLCDDCGSRVRPRTLESLPPHNCAERARARREAAARDGGSTDA
jgi:hypothetical protein